MASELAQKKTVLLQKNEVAGAVPCNSYLHDTINDSFFTLSRASKINKT